MKTLIIGSGIIGAASAYYLQSSGAQVTIIDAGRAQATAASFGWINASFFTDADHFRLRLEAIDAYHRLCETLSLPVNWCGCLCWENDGAALDAQLRELTEFGYAVEEIDTARFARLEPNVANPPERCLRFTGEGAAESGELADILLQAAIEHGAQIINGLAVSGFLSKAGRISGVMTPTGPINADQVVVATGTGTQKLMAEIGVAVPMLDRPALVLKTPLVKPVIDHILVSGSGEVRQLPNGALVMPTVAGHQGDDSAEIDTPVNIIADETLARLQALLPGCELTWAEATLAYRPMPRDGLPVAGPVMPGLYVACMHSGITLGPLMGELIAKEINHGITNQTAQWLTPYRPDRFQAPSG